MTSVKDTIEIIENKTKEYEKQNINLIIKTIKSDEENNINTNSEIKANNNIAFQQNKPNMRMKFLK